MSDSELSIIKQVKALAIARKGIRKNLTFDLIKAELEIKLGELRSVEKIYYQALEKEIISQTDRYS